MEFNDDVFKKIILESGTERGRIDISNVEGYGDDVYKDLETHEEIILQNKDLYDIFFEINRILEKRPYESIQSVNPGINVNTGVVTISGLSKGTTDDDRAAIDMFIADMTHHVGDDMKVDSYVDRMDNMNVHDGKYKFNIVISRKKVS